MTTATKARQEFKVQGLDCPDEVAVLKREVGPVVGGDAHLTFDILNARMIVNAGPDEVAPEKIVAAVARTGMRAVPWRDDKVGEEGLDFWSRWGRTILTVASGSAAVVGAAFHVAGGWGDKPGVVAQVGYAVSILAGLWLVLPKAWIALKRLRPDMNLLMVVAVAGAVVIGEWAEAATTGSSVPVVRPADPFGVGEDSAFGTAGDFHEAMDFQAHTRAARYTDLASRNEVVSSFDASPPRQRPQCGWKRPVSTGGCAHAGRRSADL